MKHNHTNLITGIIAFIISYECSKWFRITKLLIILFFNRLLLCWVYTLLKY
jgi:hypothetical protein